MDDRIIVLAPRGRDSEIIKKVLDTGGFISHIVDHVAGLIAAVTQGAGAAVIAEEALAEGDLTRLRNWLSEQEPWSDFPFVVLVSQRAQATQQATNARLNELGNIVMLERPVNTATLKSAAGAAMRGRLRQYQARNIMAERVRAAERLHASQAELLSLNDNLENRIRERTLALAQANDRLMNESAERERVQQALIQFQKMEAIGQLTGGIAHDFNNLLNVIQGNLDLILHQTIDEGVKRRAEVARRTCQKGAKLTSQLLAFSRNQRLNLAPTDLSKMFEGIRELVLTSIGGSVTLNMAVEDDCCSVMADVHQLEMALLNLAINARDAMGSGGRLLFAARRADALPGLLPEGEYGVISVTDSGSGISSSIIDKIFDPFFTTKEVGKGTGLGLSQVYGMAQQSGGTAQVRSSPTGTTVEIWLPISSSKETSGDNTSPKDGPAAPAGVGTILVVEDDASVRGALVEMLRVLGYKVNAVESGTLALELINESPPDLMITDYLMPGMTGAMLIQRAQEISPDLPIIMITGYADMNAVDEVIGSHILLRKPFNLQQLAGAVSSRLAR